MDMNLTHDNRFIWVFCGEGAHFPCACFTTLSSAIAWISETQVSGCLTQYPLDISHYDWAINNGYFLPKFPSHHSPKFIQRFTCAVAKHYHFENGICEGFQEKDEEEKSFCMSARAGDLSPPFEQ